MPWRFKTVEDVRKESELSDSRVQHRKRSQTKPQHLPLVMCILCPYTVVYHVTLDTQFAPTTVLSTPSHLALPLGELSAKLTERA